MTTILQQPTPHNGPHQGQMISTTGKPLDQAAAAMILVHGRGATAPSILGLAQEFNHNQFAYLAPPARNNTWYNHSFLNPLTDNQPGLDSALQAIADVVAFIEKSGLPAEKIIIGGFSQGACLSMEYIARNAKRYGGAFAYSGGVIGPLNMPRAYGGSLEGTPIFLGCSDVDFHIPVERVHETAAVMTTLGGNVTKKIYPQMGHTVNIDEIQHVQAIMTTLTNRTHK